jgi:hypothetical protein
VIHDVLQHRKHIVFVLTQYCFALTACRDRVFQSQTLTTSSKRAAVAVLPAAAAEMVLERLAECRNCSLEDRGIEKAAAFANQHCGLTVTDSIVSRQFVLVPLRIGEVWRSVLLCDAVALPGGPKFGIGSARRPTAFVLEVEGDCVLTDSSVSSSFVRDRYPHADTWNAVTMYETLPFISYCPYRQYVFCDVHVVRTHALSFYHALAMHCLSILLLYAGSWLQCLQTPPQF